MSRTRTGLAAGVLSCLVTVSALAAEGEPRPWQLWHQSPVTPTMERLDSFHYLLLVIMIGICTLVVALLGYVIVRFNARRNPVPSRTTHNTVVEIVWTVVPVIILIIIAVPSFQILYFMDRATQPEMTLKITGHQWYWEYTYPDQGDLNFSSYMVAPEDIQPGQPRLLAVDAPVVLPVGTTIRILVTAGDVLHAWTIPAFGIKDDAVPGRTNESWIHIEREGVYYGQCSEICGTGHGYMPIAVEAVSREAFAQWVAKTKAAQGQDPDNDPREPPPTRLAATPAPTPPNP